MSKYISEYLESKDIKQLMAEADELVKRIDTDAIKDLKEEHRLQVEKHAQHLKKIKSAVQDKIEKKDDSKKDHGAYHVAKYRKYPQRDPCKQLFSDYC